MSLLSRSVSLCGYSLGFPGDVAPNNSAVIENVDFQKHLKLAFKISMGYLGIWDTGYGIWEISMG